MSAFKWSGSSFFFLIALILCCFLLLLFHPFKNNIHIVNTTPSAPPDMMPRFGTGIGLIPSYPFNNLGRDVLLDPYVPPLRDERYYVPAMYGGRLPINISTNPGAVNTSYRQVGILTPMNGPSTDQILPLMGRPLYTSRSKWQYYTISNQHNNVKLPVIVNKRKGTDENGVNEVSEGDRVFVQGVKEKYKVTLYDNDSIQYLPFL